MVYDVCCMLCIVTHHVSVNKRPWRNYKAPRVAPGALNYIGKGV